MKTRETEICKKILSILLTAIMLVNTSTSVFAQTASAFSKIIEKKFGNEKGFLFRGIVVDENSLKNILQNGLQTKYAQRSTAPNLFPQREFYMPARTEGAISLSSSPEQALDYSIRVYSEKPIAVFIKVKKVKGRYPYDRYSGHYYTVSDIPAGDIEVFVLQEKNGIRTVTKIRPDLENYSNLEFNKLKTGTIPEKVSEILKSANPHETARIYFKEVGIKELPDMIHYAQNQVGLKINGKLPAEFFMEAFAKSMLEKSSELDKYLNKAVKKYSPGERAKMKAAFTEKMQEGKVPDEIAEAFFPKATQTAKKLGFWERIKLIFKNGKAGKAGSGFGVAMLGFIIGMELISGKAFANISGLEKRLAMSELVGGEYGPALAGTFCAKEPEIMGYVIQDYAGDKEKLTFWLTEYFIGQMDLVRSEDIMNEPVIKAALGEWSRRQAEGKKEELQKNLQKKQEELQKKQAIQDARNAMFEGRSKLGRK
ncbi:MAG: hypothetical protein LBG16_03280 [Elusimicrobiota bacterium]|jgi:hypothetical protein|nr:hypothetical protein [Elusimicrobiota bacterium]